MKQTGRIESRVRCSCSGEAAHRHHIYAMPGSTRARQVVWELNDLAIKQPRAHAGCAPWQAEFRFVSEWQNDEPALVARASRFSLEPTLFDEVIR